MNSKIKYLLGCALALCSPWVLCAQNNFIAGADLSLLAYFETNGIVYADNGQPGDAVQILKNHGINCIRLRLFTSSAAQAQADPYDYINNLTYTVPLAVRVKNAGLQFMLDFHYSDTWADPGHQATPAAWAGLTFAQLVPQMRAYNSNAIATFAAAGAMPDYVQIGNEITDGMLWTNGQLTGMWSSSNPSWIRLGELMTNAIQGIRDAANAAGAPMPKIVVHIDRGGDWNTTKSFFDNLNAQGVPYDIIGESYYPFYHGPYTNLANCVTNAAKRYGKPIFIAETDFPYIFSTNIYGIPATTNGQVQFVITLAQIVKSAPNNLGAGIFWWGAEYQYPNANQAGVGTRSFFGSDANLLPAADAFGQLSAPVDLSVSLTGPNLMLQWPINGAGMNLMTTTNLGPPAVWSSVTNSVQNTGTIFDVTLPLDPVQSRFYRLQSN
ncbi:MAG TPA: glycosyl hydrolase 53 family protein [Candidatus Limnocylindrales bacterium]|nr:glycosyl hydrolase 53 family protein [Candidatus Limnocylindrales bacterium]